MKHFDGFLTGISVVLLGICAQYASAQQGTLYSFGATSTDAAQPNAGLISDSAGNLYGTSVAGGANSAGTVFELSPASSGAWTEKVLYSFGANSTDAAAPTAGLIFDTAGNLYGETSTGGANSKGTAFELSPAGGGNWTEKILYSFGASSTDAITPAGGLIFDASGNLYGTSQGGTNNYGTVFELQPAVAGPWTEVILYNFTGAIPGNPEQIDGSNPIGSLIFDAAGNLYGTTLYGGAGTYHGNNMSGTAFELSPSGSGSWTEKVIHPFACVVPLVANDGCNPTGTLIFDAAGNLYGTTINGGMNQSGMAFELTPAASGYWPEQVLYSFGGYAFSGKDGAYPSSSLAFDSAGNLYGTTNNYSLLNTSWSTVFELAPATGGGWTEGVLQNFQSLGTESAYGPLLLAGGKLYGLATFGGANNSGEFFVSTPLPFAAPPVLSPASGNYAAGQMVEITDSTPGATIYYSTSGNPPTSSASTTYSGPILGDGRIEAIAAAPGYLDSALVEGFYQVVPPAATPVFSPAPGTYATSQTVTIADTTLGVTVYYTTDGSTPTTSSTPYTGAILVKATETIQAIAWVGGYANSAVATATYTIGTPPPAPDFTVAVSPATLSVTSAASATATLTVTPQNGFAAATSFSCSGLPAGASCSFSPSTVTPAGAAASTTLTVSMASATAALRNESRPGFPARLPAAAFAVSLCFLGFKKRRRLHNFLLLAFTLSAASLFVACGGSGSSTPTPTTSTVTVTATAGATQHTTTFTLTSQ